MSKVMIAPEAIADGLGGVMVLKLGSNKPANFDELYSALHDLLSSQKTFLALVYDTTANIYLGDCEAAWEKEGGQIQLTQYRPYFTSSGNVMYKYVYSFYADGTYKRSHGTYTLPAEIL